MKTGIHNCNDYVCLVFHSFTFSHACVFAAAELGVNLCQEEVTTESSGEFLTPCRHGRGSCLRTLVDFLSEAHNSLVRARLPEDRSVPQLPNVAQ